jgi:hypothetical protein
MEDELLDKIENIIVAGIGYSRKEVAKSILTLIRKREMLAKVDEIKTIMWLKEHSEGWLQNRAEVMEQQLKEFN